MEANGAMEKKKTVMADGSGTGKSKRHPTSGWGNQQWEEKWKQLKRKIIITKWGPVYDQNVR